MSLLIKFIANAHTVGGGEMSTCRMMEMLTERGHKVIFHPTRSINPNFPMPPKVHVGAKYTQTTQYDCDILVYVGNNNVFRLREAKTHWDRILSRASRKILYLNFKVGQAGEAWFAPRWNKIGFLSNTLRREWLRIHPKTVTRTFVLPPPIDLQPYQDIKIDYSKLSIVRHSKSGKYTGQSMAIIESMATAAPEAPQYLMGAPSVLQRVYEQDSLVTCYPQFAMPVHEFLQKGSLFWYTVPVTWREQGPRVLVEAMAAGLPVITEYRDGMRDRVTLDTGWFADQPFKFGSVVSDIVKNPEILKIKGQEARRQMFEDFNPENWVKHILDEPGAADQAI